VKKQTQRAEQVDINDALLEVLALANNELQRNVVTVHTQLTEALPMVTADRVELQQVMLNLIANATEAMAEIDDRPRELVVVTGNDAAEVFVEVHDSGRGISPDSVDSLFQSFYTTKPDRHRAGDCRNHGESPARTGHAQDAGGIGG
jgi:C4-dicarboxylate-specific signal transduction histidine kinase